MAQIATPPPRPPLVWVTPPTGASDTTVIWLRGEHDLSTVDMLSEALASATTDVTIDLSGVDFMDSTTLMAILRAASSDAQGKAATLRNPSPSARAVCSTSAASTNFSNPHRATRGCRRQ